MRSRGMVRCECFDGRSGLVVGMAAGRGTEGEQTLTNDTLLDTQRLFMHISVIATMRQEWSKVNNNKSVNDMFHHTASLLGQYIQTQISNQYPSWQHSPLLPLPTCGPSEHRPDLSRDRPSRKLFCFVLLCLWLTWQCVKTSRPFFF